MAQPPPPTPVTLRPENDLTKDPRWQHLAPSAIEPSQTRKHDEINNGAILLSSYAQALHDEKQAIAHGATRKMSLRVAAETMWRLSSFPGIIAAQTLATTRGSGAAVGAARDVFAANSCLLIERLDDLAMELLEFIGGLDPLLGEEATDANNACAVATSGQGEGTRDETGRERGGGT